MHHYRAGEVDVLNALSPNMNFNVGVETIGASATLTAADNGKIFITSVATTFAITLPNIVGFRCTVIIGVAPTGDIDVIAGTADSMAGTILSASGGAEDTEAAATGDKLTFASAAGVGKVGDRADFVCDGTRVFAFGICSTAAGILIQG